MAIPLQARNHGGISSSSLGINDFLDLGSSGDLQSSQMFCERTLYVFPTTSLNDDCSFYVKDKQDLVNLVNDTYQETVPVSWKISNSSNLSEISFSIDMKASCLDRLKNFFLRLLAVLKKFFCMEKKKKFKKSFLEKKEKIPLHQQPGKYILTKTRKPKLVDRSTQTYPEDFLTNTSLVKDQEAFYLSLMLKDMWISEEKKDLQRYTWCMQTLLTQCLQDFYKFIPIEESCLIPRPHVRLSDELYLEWEQIIPNNEDLLSIVCALLETLSGKVFSSALEKHGVSDPFIDITKKIEDSLLPSQEKVILALIARHCMTFISRQARETQRLFVINPSEAAKFVHQSSLLLSQVKQVSLFTWIKLMQILANDALKD